MALKVLTKIIVYWYNDWPASLLLGPTCAKLLWPCSCKLCNTRHYYCKLWTINTAYIIIYMLVLICVCVRGLIMDVLSCIIYEYLCISFYERMNYLFSSLHLVLTFTLTFFFYHHLWKYLPTKFYFPLNQLLIY